MKKCNKKGLTLVEMIITLSILGLLGVTLFGALTSGVKLWIKAMDVKKDQDIRFLIERLSSDLGNAMVFSGVDADFQIDRLSFPAISGDEIKKVEYKFNKPLELVTRREQGYRDFKDKKTAIPTRELEDVYKFEAKYFFRSKRDMKLEERNFIKGPALPQFVKVNLVFIRGGEKYKFSETIEVPFAREKAF